MTTPLSIDDTSSFRIRRSLMTTNGISSEVDENARRHLDELDDLLGKPILRESAGGDPGTADGVSGGPRDKGERAAAGKTAGAAATPPSTFSASYSGLTPTQLFSLPVTAKHVPAFAGHHTSWDDGSLAAYLLTHDGKASESLSDHIDKTSDLAQLKYAFLDRVRENWALLPFNSRVVIEHYSNLTDYLIASAYYRLDIRDADALKHVIIDNRSGTRVFADYAVAGAARSIIHRELLKVDNYNENDGQFLKKLIASGVPLSARSLEKFVRDKTREFMFDRDEESIVRHAQVFSSLPPELLPQLVKYLQQSPLQVTKANVDAFLPGIVLQLVKQTATIAPGLEAEPSDEDFRVQFEDDSDGSIEVNRSAVLCAAQLYHGMVLGEELDVFGAVHYLAHRRMNTFGGMRVEDPTLRADLQRYVFDNRYVDLGDKSVQSVHRSADKYRTRPAERQMFHRQVFDEGHAEMPEDMLVNREFKRLWKVLMLESARYLDRAQASMNPESFVSRQNVMQAVEDLQYNLSTHCTGMATVLSPAVDAELNFVLEMILKHKEVLRQVVPEGGTWKRAIDKLNGERRKQVGPATTLYNKATLGKGIIEMIADYTPAGFENDGIFSAFISKVDAFVTTQSILQRPIVGFNEPSDDDDEVPHDEMPPAMPVVQANAGNGNGNGYGNGNGNGAAPADEWDF
jgi:hypothetical protein